MLEENLYDYANGVGLEDRKYEKLVDQCTSADEIDALTCCLDYIDTKQSAYAYALANRPRDTKKRQKAFENRIKNAKNQTEVDDIIAHRDFEYPVRASIQEIKDDISESCELWMKDAGMGNKRWKRLKPLLRRYMGHPLTQDERAGQRSFAQLLRNKLNKINFN
jgi:hypothetical protein